MICTNVRDFAESCMCLGGRGGVRVNLTVTLGTSRLNSTDKLQDKFEESLIFF